MPKSKKFCIATEGATTDGRTIERDMLEQMAANYDPKKYGARINMEHIKGYAATSEFRRFGDVLSLSTAEGDDGKLRLYAVIDPTDELVTMTNKDRQKVYTSMEVNPNFADTGEAYLVGLAVTDDPASLGTEMLKFSATATKNPLAKRKTHSDNLFTEATEAVIELDDDTQSALEGFSAKIKGMLAKFSSRTDSNTAELQTAIQTIAESQTTLLEQFNKLETGSQQYATLKSDLEKLSADHQALVITLGQQPNSPPRDRTPGGDANHLTDC